MLENVVATVQLAEFLNHSDEVGIKVENWGDIQTTYKKHPGRLDHRFQIDSPSALAANRWRMEKK